MWSVKHTCQFWPKGLHMLSFVQAGRSNISLIQLEREGRCVRGGRLRKSRSRQNDNVEYTPKKKKKTLTDGKEKIQYEKQTSNLNECCVGFFHGLVSKLVFLSAYEEARQTTLEGHLTAARQWNMAGKLFPSLCIFPSSRCAAYTKQHPFFTK